jgi:hypothetical protein
MQQIWARILAGEVARPGSFAPRTLSVVRDLTKHDAHLFTKVCSFAWAIPGSGLFPVIHDIEAPAFVEANIDFPQLMHLTSIGLIEYETQTGFGLKLPVTEISPSYFGAVYQLKSEGGQKRRFKFGHTLFTAVGAELFGISGAQKNDGYCKATLETWSQDGWKQT